MCRLPRTLLPREGLPNRKAEEDTGGKETDSTIGRFDYLTEKKHCALWHQVRNEETFIAQTKNEVRNEQKKKENRARMRLTAIGGASPASLRSVSTSGDRCSSKVDETTKAVEEGENNGH